MALVGTRVLRTEDHRLLLGKGSYVDNLRVPELAGSLHAVFVRSPMAHASIGAVDIEAAGRAPGVLAVVTAAQLDLPAFPLRGLSQAAPVMAQPVLAGATVRYAGEPVAVVVAEDRYLAADAAELVVVDYEPLPAVVSAPVALAGQTLVYPEAGTNIVHEVGDLGDDSVFAGCEVVVGGQLRNQRVAAVPLETRAAACAPAPDGGLVLWLSTQTPHLARDVLSRLLNLVPGQLRVLAPDVGGGFGAKLGVDREAALVCWLARHLGRPVRWTETRSEGMLAMGHGRGQEQTVTIGGRRDGTILAYRLDTVADAGAYPAAGGWMVSPTVTMASGAYAIPQVSARGRSVVTTTAPTRAYRGAGRPEATAAIERAVDLFAAEIGMDPAEVRRRNLVPRDAFPYTTPTGAEYDSGDYRAALDAVLDAADYPTLRADQARRRADGGPLQYGIGLSSYVEITGLGADEYARLEVGGDGSVVAHVGTSPQGQGHETTLAMLVADRLGVPVDRVDVRHGDTDALSAGGGTFGSRSLQLAGSALHEASDRLCDESVALAAAALGVAERDVALDRTTGTWRARDRALAGLTWAQLAGGSGAGGRLVVEVKYSLPHPTFAFGAHLAVVEVDVETGAVRLLRYLTVDDAGRVVNPLLAEGQRYGGIAQGIGQALYEEMVYDEDGNPVTATLADYTIPSAADLPRLELLWMQTPTPHNPLGAKGVGEAGTVGAVPAVQNAVVDAVSYLGVRHIDIPLTPQRVWEAVRRAPGRLPGNR
jgi:carbon-monoxide dehydrogenase large subunit